MGRPVVLGLADLHAGRVALADVAGQGFDFAGPERRSAALLVHGRERGEDLVGIHPAVAHRAREREQLGPTLSLGDDLGNLRRCSVPPFVGEVGEHCRRDVAKRDCPGFKLAHPTIRLARLGVNARWQDALVSAGA